MKLFGLLLFLSFNLFAQVEVLQSFDKKTYTPRMRAVTDLVVDVENEKLRDQLNEQKLFGQVKNLAFRFYWTAQPERLAVEVLGLPDGFREIKEELKVSVTPMFEHVIPISLEKKFSNFTLKRRSKQVIEAKDKNSLAAITGYDLVFNNSDTLSEVITQRPVGEMVTKFVYDKTSFSDGRWVLMAQETQIEESGQKVNIKKEISYHVESGAGFPKTVNIKTKQSSSAGNLDSNDIFNFTNYQINKGEALKYFLNESK